MTNQTIDGVPRKSLEQALKLAAVFDDGGDGADAESARGVVWILRALLDAPSCSTCNDTGRMHEPGCEPGACTACFEKPAAQPQVEPVAWQIRTKTNREGSAWTDWAQCSEMERALHSHEAGKFNRFGVMREIRPVYAEQPAPVAVVPEPSYRLLGDGDIIQDSDETLNDDTATWGKVPMGVFIGMPYNRRVMLPVRRAKP